MRKFLLTVTLIILGAWPLSITAQKLPTIIKSIPTPKKVEAYTKQLSDLQTWSKNLNNDKFYEGRFSFKEKDVEKEKKFSEFSLFDRRMFQMTTTQRFSRHLEKLEETWQEELKKATDKIPDSKGIAGEVIGADDLGKFIVDLVKIRKEVAQSWETQANSVFKDFPKEFEEKDRTLYLKNIKILKDSLEKR